MAKALGDLRFRAPSDHETARLVPALLGWLYEAGNPFYEWFFSELVDGPRTVGGWMLRPSSEVSLSRIELLVDGDVPVGGFVALGGDELLACRRADALALMTSVAREAWGRVEQKATIARELFPPVESDDYYLSKMGVVPERRGRGHGAAIAAEYVEAGVRHGFRRFRLDVWAENSAAIRLYESLGFETIAESTSERAGLTYRAMAYELAG
jgi:ribosomal protein S18 acetylase RimI-like enzyme